MKFYSMFPLGKGEKKSSSDSRSHLACTDRKLRFKRNVNVCIAKEQGVPWPSSSGFLSS